MALFDNMPYTNLHELNLDWIIQQVKQLAADWETFDADMTAKYNNLHDYVYNYFAQLDLTAEVQAIINQMASDGTLQDMIDAVIDDKDLPGVVTAWLQENVTPVGSAVIVDSSLTIAGAAADAKVTGDMIGEIALNNRHKVIDLIPDRTVFTEEQIQLHNGTSRAFGGFLSTDYIKIDSNDKQINFNLYAYNRTTSGRLYEIDSVAFYDAGYSYISGVCYPETTSANGIRFASSVDVPANAVYVKFVDREAVNLVEPYATLVDKGVMPISIAFIGDSLIQGMEDPSLGPGQFIFVDNPIPNVVKNIAAANGLFDIKVHNFGRRGLSASTYWRQAIPIDGRYHNPDAGEPGDIIEFNKYPIDVIYIMLGTNGNLSNNTIDADTDIEPGETYQDYADTQCGNYCKIVEYCMEKLDNKVSIIIAVPPYAKDATIHNKILNSINTISALAERYNAPLVNVFRGANINDFNYSTYMNNEDLTHFNQDGYNKMAMFIYNQIMAAHSAL